jgi:hypothetical protein
MDEGEHKLVADVETFGWHVINVLEDDAGPPFSYSVGLHPTLGHPEVIIVGLPRDAAHPIINSVGEAARAGRRYEAGGVYDDFLEGYDCTFRAVPRRQYPNYGLGDLVLRWRGIPAVAARLPRRHGRWPWQPGVAGGFRARQPVLADEGDAPQASRPAT